MDPDDIAIHLVRLKGTPGTIYGPWLDHAIAALHELKVRRAADNPTEYGGTSLENLARTGDFRET